MKHIQTIQKPCIKAGSDTACGECQASCQSACKTSCTVANQKCAKEEK
ncbi:MAG TPA: six-cysteine peptide SCIFF [Clostridiales bacterium]|nr:six-cysteine peptide SCIFF [Clostridiales bacterium]